MERMKWRPKKERPWLGRLQLDLDHADDRQNQRETDIKHWES